VFRKDTATLWDDLSRRARSVTALRERSSQREDAKDAKKREDLKEDSSRTSALFAPLR
jgi:hypothetical protein